jgi:protein phosphatase
MLESFALSDKGCVRSNNEDYCLIDADRGLYVLADGMGGAKAGERASRMAVETVAETVRSSPARDSQVLIRAAEEANRRVLEAAHSDPALEGMGTTLVAALDLDTELAIASVGDSRAYVMMDGQGLKMITDDQTWVNEVGRPLGLDEESLRHHPMRHVLTMAIGASSPLAINHYRVPLSSGTMVLICSDGLHGVLETPELESILATGRGTPLEDSCRKLIQAAKDAGGPDNVTAVLMRKTG